MYAGCFLVPLPEGIITQIAAGVQNARRSLSPGHCCKWTC